MLMGDYADDARYRDEANQADRDLFGETRTYTVAEVTLATSKALRIQIVGGGEHWIARSQISPASPVQEKGDSGKLIISEWLAGRLDDEARGIGKARAEAGKERQTKAALREQAAEIRQRRGFGTP